MKICPKGSMTKEQFLEKSKDILGEQAGVMGEGLFRVFDEDNSGSIDIDEVIKLVIGLFTMGGVEPQKEVLLASVQEILEAVDENNDGDITKDEFVENALKSESIKNLMGEEE